MLAANASRPLLAAGLGAALTAAAFVHFAGCGSDDPRRGGLGESCERTDDCEAPLACVNAVCSDPNAPPDGGTGGSGGSGGGDGGKGPSADAGPWSECDECLETTCATAETACDADCHALEACIEVLCANLSAIGSGEEGACQVKCQGDHPGGKTAHLGVVDCAQKEGTCVPPCAFYPQDYDECRAFMNAGDCKDALSACNASLPCQSYRDCVSTCTTLKDCIACDDTPDGQAGKKLLDTYAQCIASECVTESWLP